MNYAMNWTAMNYASCNELLTVPAMSTMSKLLFSTWLKTDLLDWTGSGGAFWVWNVCQLRWPVWTRSIQLHKIDSVLDVLEANWHQMFWSTYLHTVVAGCPLVVESLCSRLFCKPSSRGLCKNKVKSVQHIAYTIWSICQCTICHQQRGSQTVRRRLETCWPCWKQTLRGTETCGLTSSVTVWPKCWSLRQQVVMHKPLNSGL